MSKTTFQVGSEKMKYNLLSHHIRKLILFLKISNDNKSFMGY